MATVNQVVLTPAQLQTKISSYLAASHASPSEAPIILDVLKILIDLGLVSGVTASDVETQHRALNRPTKISG